MKKDLKKQIKRDELVTGYERARVAFDEHEGEIKIAALVLVVLAVGAFALRHFSTQRDRDAREALSAAVQTYRAPVASEGPSEDGAPTVFQTPEEKYRKALTEFEGVERRYGSNQAAIRARYYTALCRIELGQNDEAEKTLRDLAARKDGEALEPALARLALADLHARLGRIDQAVDGYKQIADDAGFPLPRDHALHSLAKLYEKTSKPAEAQAAYRQLIEKFPESTYTAEAKQRAEFLQVRG